MDGKTILTHESDGYFDPGIGAILGAAAFLGGSGRVTLFTTVMMVEITGDPIMIFPVGFATFFAVLVGNAINHGLYHALIDVQSLPYLPDTWQSDQLPPRILVENMMPPNKPLVVKVTEGKQGISAAIDGNPYTGFPLVNEHDAIIGMLDRAYLEELMQKDGPVSADDFMDVADMYPLTVRRKFPLQLAYQLFKAMDMRNLVVVDDAHKPIAVMTRFAFLAWRVRERLGEKFDELQQEEVDRRVSQRRRSGSGGDSGIMNFSMQRHASLA